MNSSMSTTFPHKDLDEDIYISQPVGFMAMQEQGHLVYNLKKSLYGVKQASRMWYQKFDTFGTSAIDGQTPAHACTSDNWPTSRKST